jgi:hypothetical protein
VRPTLGGPESCVGWDGAAIDSDFTPLTISSRFMHLSIDGSCPREWCSSRWVAAFTGIGRSGQLAIAGRLTAGSSLKGAMVSRVM